MRYRQLGNTGITVSEIGFGGWGIGGATKGASSYGSTDDKESIRALEEAYNQGINFFDTSGIYGRSEELIGSTFTKRRRHQVVIATKVGFAEHNGPQDFSAANLLNSLMRSLKKLKTDYVDLYQLHSPKIEEIDLDEIADALSMLKSAGLIRAFGVSVKFPNDGLTILEHGCFGALQVNLSMIDQRAIDNVLLIKANNQGVGIIGRTPLNFGFLSDKGLTMSLNFGPQDHRSAWPMRQREAWQKAARLFSEISRDLRVSLVELALRFCLDSDGVSTVIPGMLTGATVLEDIKAANLPSLSDETMDRIRRIYLGNDRFQISKSTD